MGINMISPDLSEIFGLTPDKVLNYAVGLGTSTKEEAPVSGQKLNKRKEQP
jgi:hypothetical protein